MKHILITGASSGIGKSLALLYAQKGWQVIAGGRNQQALNELVAQFKNITPLVADLCDESARYQRDRAAAAARLTRVKRW